MMRRNRAAWPLLVATLCPFVLAGCESTARQDPLWVRNSTDVLVFHDTPLYRDRPLNESLLSSIDLADYSTALNATGLLAELQRPGPYTVFAIPNQPLEAAQAAQSGHLMDAAALPALRRTLAFSIVKGRYSDAVLRGMIARQRGPIGLHTLSGDILTVSVDGATNQLLLSDAQGQTNRIWLSDMPQSNGVLYATQSMLSPTAPVMR